jgi:omega-amidase
MRISIVQPDLVWENKRMNLPRLRERIFPLSGLTDIVILPEMFNTGFSVNAALLYEPYGSSTTLSWMKKLAEDGNFGICGSFIVKEDEHFFNRWIFISPGTEPLYYDKRHLFTMADENKYLTCGKSHLSFCFNKINISPFVCYDLRFPAWCRIKTDLMIFSANWPGSRREAWLTLIKARAIENQCYVAASNRIGVDGNGISYYGDSMIIDPSGKIITSAENNECVISGEISAAELSETRTLFPVLDDSDTFVLKY